MTMMRSKGRGDLFVKLRVETPVNLSAKQKELLEEFADFKRSKKLKEQIIRINDLEEESDRLFMSSMRDLHTQSTDPLRIIAWREIYGYLEYCADACEHAADVVESVVMKNS